MTTTVEAYEDIYTLFKAQWDTTGYVTHYENVKKSRDSSTDPYTAIFIRIEDTRQTTFGLPGQREFTSEGRVTVQLFYPIGKALSGSIALATTIKSAFEGVTSPNGVIFRNVTANEIGRDGDFFQTNITAAISFCELK